MAKFIKPFLAIGALVALAVVGAGAADGARPNACLTKQAFAQFGDMDQYALLIGGTIETGSPWKAGGNPTAVADNEPYFVAGLGHRRALELRLGDAAGFHAGCLPRLNPALRFFAKSVGSPHGTLLVQLEYQDLSLVPHTLTLAELSAADFADWAPTQQLAFLDTNRPLSDSASGNIRMILTPRGTGSKWRVDDAYVDPYRVRR